MGLDQAEQINEEVDSLKKKVNNLESITEDLPLKINKTLLESKTSEEQNVKDDISPDYVLKCDQCDYICPNKDEMKELENQRHEKICHKRCTICGKSFHQNHELETHLKSHSESERFNCAKCGKEFVLKWRLRKHMSVHATNKYCHYFNNQKSCPFKLLGCKFKHEESPTCKFKKPF